MSVATLTVCARSRHQECLARIVRVNVCADGIEINFFFSLSRCLFRVHWILSSWSFLLANHSMCVCVCVASHSVNCHTAMSRAQRTANSICERVSIHFPYKKNAIHCAYMCIIHDVHFS